MLDGPKGSNDDTYAGPIVLLLKSYCFLNAGCSKIYSQAILLASQMSLQVNQCIDVIHWSSVLEQDLQLVVWSIHPIPHQKIGRSLLLTTTAPNVPRVPSGGSTQRYRMSDASVCHHHGGECGVARRIVDEICRHNCHGNDPVIYGTLLIVHTITRPTEDVASMVIKSDCDFNEKAATLVKLVIKWLSGTR